MDDKTLLERAQMYAALKRITAYMKPDQLRRRSEKEYGLEYDEALEYAYDNVLMEAARGLKGVRKPKSPDRAAAALAGGDEGEGKG